MQTARRARPIFAKTALALTVIVLGTCAFAAPRVDPPSRPFPTGRMLGTLYYGFLDWHDPQMMDEAMDLDFIVMGEWLHDNDAHNGVVNALHAAKPTLKVLQYFAFGYIWDECAPDQDPPQPRPCNELGQALYDAFYPNDIAHMAETNPSPAVGDTAYHTEGYYMIDFDNPGVAERAADIIYAHVQSGFNPDVDGIFLDWFQSNWGGWCLYGNSPGELGYRNQWNYYWLDYDRDGIPCNQDLDERKAVHDAYARFVQRLRVLFGDDFLVFGNGEGSLYDTPMSNGEEFIDQLDGRYHELFPWHWSNTNHFLPPFDLAQSPMWGGQTVWELANHGRHNPSVPTANGNYYLMDTLNRPNGPWICLSALMVDNAVAFIGGDNMDDHREDWFGGDPMPLLDNLGPALSPAERSGTLWTRSFLGGTVYMDFTNSPADLIVIPYTDGEIHAPNGPFKYLVLGTAMGDTLYRGGGWPRAAATDAGGRLVQWMSFEDDRWFQSLTGGGGSVARVSSYPHGGAGCLRGNLKQDTVDPITGLPGVSACDLTYDAGGTFETLTGNIFVRFWWRWDNFNWSGVQSGRGVTTSLLDATTDQIALSLVMGYTAPPGNGAPTGGELEVRLAPDLASWGQMNWGDSVARLGDPTSPPLLPLDNDWHEIAIFFDRAAGTLSIWVDSERILARPGDAPAQQYYPDGRLPLPVHFDWSGLRFAAASANEVNLSTDGTGYAAGWQLDDIEIFDGYYAGLGRPGRPTITE